MDTESAGTVWGVIIYFLICIITAGFAQRSGARFKRAIFYGTVWPSYWLGIVGPTATVQILAKAIADMTIALLGMVGQIYRARFSTIFEVVYLCYAGGAFVSFFWFLNWKFSYCAGPLACIGAAVMSVLCALGWPAFVLAGLR